MKRTGKWVVNIILGLVLCFVLLAVLIPSVFSGSLAIVRSSSMEPAMRAGALAVMLPIDPEDVKVGDVIAFDPPWDPDVIVSHRVMAVHRNEQTLFDTKGDATEETDPYYVPAANVHGKVIFSIPYLGYAASYAVRYVRTWQGFVFLVCIPAAIIVGSTIRDVNRSHNVRVKRLASRLERQRRWRKRAFSV
ncbi:MAG: signal peptidase I [Chloroflexi bacterium RBG_13_51_36]|nr:MAG: signal peptidase I [Chloroflexi bacterium RBG_13_51_36]